MGAVTVNRLLGCLLASYCLLLAGLAHAATTEDERAIGDLRAKQRFAQAEQYCRDRLAMSGGDSVRRALLVTELSRTLAEHALSSPPADREALWQQAAKATREFLEEDADNPRSVLIRTQAAMTTLAHGELSRQELETAPAGDKLLDGARSTIRDAAKQLKQLDADIAAALVRRNRTKAAVLGELSADELRSLQANVRFQLARAFRNQGLCYPPDSPDRINALTQSIEALRPLTLLSDDDPLAWPSRLDEVICLRLVRDGSAQNKLNRILQGRVPDAIKSRALAERLRLQLARADVDEAVAIAREGGEAPGSGDLAYAELEVSLAAWQRATKQRDASGAADWEQRAADQVRRIEKSYGPYWMRRAETLLAATIATSPGAQNLDALARSAASLYRSGKIAEALTAYDRAVEQAAASKQPQQAFDLAFTAATIEHDRKHHDAALARYRKLSLGATDNPKAGEAHLLAIYNAAQLARTSVKVKTDETSALDRYSELLAEHLEHWPSGPSAAQVLSWQGRLEEGRRAWPAAIKAYRAIPREAAQFAESVEALGRCYEAWLAELRTARKPHDELAATAAKYFESLVVDAEGNLPDAWTPVERSAALAAAKVWIGQAPQGYPRAQQILSVALEGADDAPAQWKNTVRTLLFSCLAAQGEVKEAAALLKQMSADAPSDLLSMLAGVSRIAQSSSPPLRGQLAELQLQALDLIGPQAKRLDASARQQLPRLRAQALADAGRRVEALAAFETLAKQLPNDGQIQESLASLLLAGSEATDWQAADIKWREVIAKSRPGTARWFRANYSVAKAQLLLGDRTSARATIRLVQATHPELGGAAIKADFLKLLAQCEEAKQGVGSSR